MEGLWCNLELAVTLEREVPRSGRWKLAMKAWSGDPAPHMVTQVLDGGLVRCIVVVCLG